MIFPFKIENFLSKTLLFLITTILILIILVLGLIVYNETAAIRHENIIKTQLSIKSVITVIEEYKKDRGEYPKSLDQLKNKIIKVIIIVLIVKFFEKILMLTSEFTSPNDILLFSISILAICIGYYLINKK